MQVASVCLGLLSAPLRQGCSSFRDPAGELALDQRTQSLKEIQFRTPLQTPLVPLLLGTAFASRECVCVYAEQG